MPSNAMARQLLQQAKEYFPREVRGEEDCDGPGQERRKNLHLAQLKQDGGKPAGEVQAVLLLVHQRPAAAAAVYLSYVAFSDTNMLSAVWFG